MAMPLALNELNRNYETTISIYKTYHEVKDQPEKLRQFMLSLDQTYIREQGVYIPGYTFDPPDHLSCSGLHGKTALAIRHANFLPMFCHSHDFVEIIFVASGHGRNITDEGTVELSAGDLLILPPNLPHMIFVDTDGWVFNLIFSPDYIRTHYDTVFCRPGRLTDYMTGITLGKSPGDCLLCHVDDVPPLFNLAELMWYESVNQADDPVLCDLLTTIFRWIIRVPDMNIRSSLKGSEVIYEVFRIMRSEFRDISLGRLAERLHYSSDYISRIIKNATGKGFSDFLLEIRVNHACVLLTTTDLTNEEIAARCGYAYADQFYKRFKACIGMTPTEYRRRGTD